MMLHDAIRRMPCYKVNRTLHDSTAGQLHPHISHTKIVVTIIRYHESRQSRHTFQTGVSVHRFATTRASRHHPLPGGTRLAAC